MNIEKARYNMIEQQIRPWDVLDQEVLDLLAVVKREQFVPPQYRSLAFVDMEIPLGDGENMLAPKMEARILQELSLQPHEVVLEIGAGSGYMAALLASKARRVTTVDISPALATIARDHLANAKITNAEVVAGDAAAGWPAAGEVDIIVVSGSLPVMPEEILRQIRPGGRIIAFVGDAPVMEAQRITRTSENTWETVNLFETVVTPLRNARRPSRFSF